MLLEETIENIRPLDRSKETEIQARLDSLTKPPGSLGILEQTAARVARIQGAIPPRTGQKRLFVFAADHGIVAEGVSAYPKEVTAQMTYNFLHGGAAINVLARHHEVEIEVVDMGVDHEFPKLPGLRPLKIRRGTANFAEGPAMTEQEAVRSLETGIRLAQEAAGAGCFLLGAGEMGIGNTSSAAAIFCALTGLGPRDVAGTGTGVDNATWERKIRAIEKGLDLHRPNAGRPLEALAKVGGLEIGAMSGTILGAAANRLPMVLDGYIAGAAALLACRFNPDVVDFLFASHLSAEKGHGAMLRELGLRPLIDLEMRLGEGTGACIAMGLIEAGVKIMREMATFKAAGVREKNS
jgi:nicotinate-nucleotide--dimethylbenzimidazole phosphoribosyltransferase